MTTKYEHRGFYIHSFFNESDNRLYIDVWDIQTQKWRNAVVGTFPAHAISELNAYLDYVEYRGCFPEIYNPLRHHTPKWWLRWKRFKRWAGL